ncbi:MAG: hypothetical protein MJ211_11885 [Bacteroidales bacterium]|nr:hypothetical protein [Bacteroidales bacterium]
MYKLKTENFCLEITPIFDSILVKVYCDDFSGHTVFDTEDFLVADFILQIKDMYKNLSGSAKIQDLYQTDSYIKFTTNEIGHITVKGEIIYNNQRNTQQLTFETDFDQTYLRDFVDALVADYSKYADDVNNVQRN